MKTVTGVVVSSNSISLSKAAPILSRFAAAENGATQAINAYLRRASAALNELNQVHRELKSHGKDNVDKSDVTKERKPKGEPSDGIKDGSWGKKQKKRERGEFGGMVENGAEIGARVNEALGKRVDDREEGNKKKSGRNMEDGVTGEIGEDGENDGMVRLEAGEKKVEKKKKRRREELEDRGEIGSEERRSKKKKGRKSEGRS